MPEAKGQEENARYGELIKTLVPISELAPQLQNELIGQACILNFNKKEFVFKEGDTDDFAYYLLEGQIELLSNNDVKSTIVSGTDSARYAMARLRPRQFSARAKTDIVIMEVERTALDRLLVIDQQNKSRGMGEEGIDVEVSHITEEESGDWMTRMLQSELFSRLPTANIQKMFVLLEAVEYKAGDTVINQGDAGDYYYIIQEGRCEVIRAPTHGARLVRLAELHAGDSFGEEALLTNATRNASVRMLTDGVLMRLSKENFIALIKKPTLTEKTYAEAKKLVEADQATWLDVRYQNEFDESKLEGSLHIPLTFLRMQTDKLQKDRNYIVCCDTGGRSSAAAFLLTNLGFNVSYLKGGLSSIPQEALEKGPVPAPARETRPPPPPPAPTEEKEVKPSELEPAVRASVIETSLAKTSMKLEETMKKQSAGASDEMREVQKRLEAEKKRLEAEKKATEKEDRKLREREEEKIRKLQEEAEKRMEAEKKKLEEVYVRNTREMEKLQRMKEQAEEQIRKEREKLERETAEAQRKLQEAREALEQQAARKRAEQEEQERALQARAKANIDENRRKMAEEIAKTSEALERARQEKEQADAARRAAQEEAKKIIAEYKQKIDQERIQERARLQEERSRLEEESRKIQQNLQEIQMTRQELEATRAAAQAEVQALRMKQQEVAGRQSIENQSMVAEQIRAMEARMQEAEQNLDNAQKAQIKATEAKVLNAQELQRHREEEEKMRRQIEEDLMYFEQEQARGAPRVEVRKTHSDHSKRIKQRADEARQKLEDANKSLLEDIAAQLGDKDDK